MTIAIKHKTSGEIQFVESLSGYQKDWAQYGPVLPTGTEPNMLTLVGAAWVEDPAKIEPMLLMLIKSEAERRKMGFLSAGGAKKAEYAQKAAEVSFYDSLGGSVVTILAAIGALTAAQRRAKFGYALADAAAFGEPTITNAIERFRSGMASSDKVPAIAAAEAKTCAAIKAATTAVAKRAAANAVSWPA
ncbi:MAG: hypothetical protein PGN16_10655 [Sphingomonas phyllosphaerae]|uniref:hypothetical protein n=1 Tax=Sphingomonas phyllosphaerae TaxID=257003 RepID=UPI002FFD17C3